MGSFNFQRQKNTLLVIIYFAKGLLKWQTFVKLSLGKIINENVDFET
jgi:hypothetical protein